MDSKVPVFVFASPEIEELLADNQTDLVELLQSEGYDVSRGFAQDPTQPSQTGTKEPVTVILATAALVTTLTPIVLKLISALSHKGVVIQEKVVEAVKDEHGNVVRDAQGQPLYYWAERSKMLQPSVPKQEANTYTIKGFGIEITSNSKENK